MVNNADKIGTTVTVGDDRRITKVGSKLRHFRLDEFPQLIDVIQGTMSFVGTRPEAVKYGQLPKITNFVHWTCYSPASNIAYGVIFKRILKNLKESKRGLTLCFKGA